MNDAWWCEVRGLRSWVVVVWRYVIVTIDFRQIPTGMRKLMALLCTASPCYCYD